MLRSRYILTPEDRLRVRQLAAIGLSDDDIACQLRLPLPKLQKLFRLELAEGAATGRERALQQLHDVALGGENTNALTFWIKSRCGWRDTGTIHSSSQIIRHCYRFHYKSGQNPPSSATGSLPQSSRPQDQPSESDPLWGRDRH
jgi:hypothetical protein